MKKVVLGKAYLVNQNYKKRIQVGGLMRGIGEFLINPPENVWTIVVELISYDIQSDFYWVRISFAAFETAPQGSLFTGQEVYLSDGPSRIFHVFIIDEIPDLLDI